jgi:OmpA-OmpF porin, OOP family
MIKNVLSTALALLALSSGVLAQQAGEQEEQSFPKEELKGVNSSYMEVRPLISGNGKTLYFGRRYHPQNIGKARDYQDVWVSEYNQESNSWSPPQNLGPVINNSGRNAIASVNADGTEGIFFNTYRSIRNTPLVRSRRTAQGWSKPQAVRIQNFVNLNDYADFYLDFRNNVLFLAIEGEESYGGQDLYISLPDGYGGWKAPVNLGNIINTREAEFAPFMGADGRSLFFCSYGHNSIGGADIFMSVRLDESWQRWSTPVNLGPSINTKQDETYFSITDDFQYIYYTSHNERQPNRNIMRAALPEDFTAINGPVLVQLDQDAIRNIMLSGNYRVSAQGRSRNFEGVSFEGWPGREDEQAAAQTPVAEAAETPAEETSPAEAGTASGRSRRPAGESARFSGFRPAGEISGLSPEAEELRRYLQQQLPDQQFLIRQQGDTVDFKLVENLEYDFNSIYVTPNYLPRLRRIGTLLQDRENVRVQLIGHTDEVGSREANERVARQRVDNLRYYFRRRGIPANRVEVLAVGSQEPLVENDTESNRRKNRRVETIIRLVR